MRDKIYYNEHRWRLSHGIAEVDREKFLLQELKETEWSKNFEQLMRNRLIIGGLRYGRLNVKPKSCYNRVESIQKRLKIYQETGNTEMLVDIANLALCEFEEGFHLENSFNPIDDGEHVSILN